MLTFKQFFEQKEEESELRTKLGLGKEYSFYYKGKWIIDTFHKLKRDYQRGSTSQEEDLFKKAIDWIIKNKASKNTTFLFASKSSMLAMVVDYRKDKNNRVKGNNLVIVTWLGDIRKLGKKSPKELFTTDKKDVKVILESINISTENYIELE